MPEIIPGLWQEPLPDDYDWDAFDVVVSLNGVIRSSPIGPDRTLIVLDVDDGDEVPDFDEVARLLARLVLRGKRILVHCRVGVNRSGLLVGLVLWHMGMSPLRIVEIIRSVVPLALSNSVFERYLKSL